MLLFEDRDGCAGLDFFFILNIFESQFAVFKQNKVDWMDFSMNLLGHFGVNEVLTYLSGYLPKSFFGEKLSFVFHFCDCFVKRKF